MKLLKLPLVGVEVGVASGCFSRDLLDAGLEKLYSVDNWATIEEQKGDGGFPQDFHDANYKSTLELLKPYGKRSIILKGLSHEMSKQVEDNSIGMIHFDGDHSYEGLMKDFQAWFPKIVDGGIISGHDFLSIDYGVNKAVHDFCNNRFQVHTMREDKDEDAGFLFLK
jgi:hypothetical protein